MREEEVKEEVPSGPIEETAPQAAVETTEDLEETVRKVEQMVAVRRLQRARAKGMQLRFAKEDAEWKEKEELEEESSEEEAEKSKTSKHFLCDLSSLGSFLFFSFLSSFSLTI